MEALPNHDQNDELLDAAITIIAKDGIARLDAEAVDQALGLLPGTTVARYATQRELIEAAAYRMVFLDSLELNGFRPSAAGIAAVIERRFTPAGRKHFIARLELVLYAVRNPEFVTMHWARDLFAAGAEAHMRIAGARLPPVAAEAVIAIVEGLSLHDLISPRMDRKTRVGLLRQVLVGLLRVGVDRL
jgi:hypothetical protein